MLARAQEALHRRRQLKSWIESANDRESDFPIENLPYGVFANGEEAKIGVAIGDQILDLSACAEAGLLSALGGEIEAACKAHTLNNLMAHGPGAWSALRRRLTTLLSEESADPRTLEKTQALLVPMHAARMQLPAQIGDYSDFYASIHHATRVGRLFRPDNPLMPNYKHLPIGYHGRASSIVVSGEGIRRPNGQIKSGTEELIFAPTRSLDYELEIGLFIGPGNAQGETIPVDEAENHIFGLCLVNDWSARDMQAWEYQPLGPFLGKSFATTISPWIVPLEALEPYRVSVPKRAEGDPPLLPYLTPATPNGLFDLDVEVRLQSKCMRESGIAPELIGKSNLRDLYWTLGQLVTHHASNGCNLRSGDLLATGTTSGPDEGSEGCLLEMRHRAQPLLLPTGEIRSNLEDGDTVTLRACASRPGAPRIGFGECAGTVLPAHRKV